MRVVIMPNLQDEMKFVRSSTFSLSSGSLLLVALYLGYELAVGNIKAFAVFLTDQRACHLGPSRY